MAKSSEILLTNTKLIIGIIISFIVLGGMFFASSQDVRDTVQIEIKANDTLDDEKYYPKEAGVTLQANVKNIKEDVEEIKSNVKEINNQMTQQYILLEIINAKLDHRDST